MKRIALLALVLLCAITAEAQPRPRPARSADVEVRLIRTTSLGDSVWVVAVVAWPNNQIEDSATVAYSWGTTTIGPRRVSPANPIGTTRDSIRSFFDGFAQTHAISVTATAWRNGVPASRTETRDYTTQSAPAPTAPTVTIEIRPPGDPPSESLEILGSRLLIDPARAVADTGGTWYTGTGSAITRAPRVVQLCQVLRFGGGIEVMPSVMRAQPACAAYLAGITTAGAYQARADECLAACPIRPVGSPTQGVTVSGTGLVSRQGPGPGGQVLVTDEPCPCWGGG